MEEESKKSTEESKKSEGKGLFIFITIILFLINVQKFINNPCSEIPILVFLFNMIFYLAIIILVIHRHVLTFGVYIQTQIEKYEKNES